MSKYNDYGEFTVAILNEADNKCYRYSFGCLAEFFCLSGANENLIPIMVLIFKIGWPAFKATFALLILGSIAFNCGTYNICNRRSWGCYRGGFGDLWWC